MRADLAVECVFAIVLRLFYVIPIWLSHPPILYVRGLFLHVLSLAHPEVLSQLCALDLQ